MILCFYSEVEKWMESNMYLYKSFFTLKVLFRTKQKLFRNLFLLIYRKTQTNPDDGGKGMKNVKMPTESRSKR